MRLATMMWRLLQRRAVGVDDIESGVLHLITLPPRATNWVSKGSKGRLGAGAMSDSGETDFLKHLSRAALAKRKSVLRGILTESPRSMMSEALGRSRTCSVHLALPARATLRTSSASASRADARRQYLCGPGGSARHQRAVSGCRCLECVLFLATEKPSIRPGCCWNFMQRISTRCLGYSSNLPSRRLGAPNSMGPKEAQVLGTPRR